MTEFTAVDPVGATHTRTSKNRVYTHTVVGLPSSVRHTLQATDTALRSLHRSNFLYHLNMANGTSKWLERKPWETDVQFATRTQQQIASSANALQGCNNAQEYEAMLVNAALERIRHDMARGFYSTYQNLGWCGRHDLAVKHKTASENRGWIGVTILEAQQA